jgi:hypothetical protein
LLDVTHDPSSFVFATSNHQPARALWHGFTQQQNNQTE